MKFEEIEYSICADCALYAASGDLPQENPTEFLEAYNHSLNLHVQKELGFSWQQCECCGSTLGGNRHKAIQLVGV